MNFVKKSLLLSALLLTVISISAAPVSRKTASQTAWTFMSQKGMLMRGEHAIPANIRKSPGIAGDACYYVFNAGRERGFVVVAADDRCESILGYSETGTFDEATIPEGLRALLDGYEREVEWLRQQEKRNTATAASVRRAPQRQKIEPLIKSRWDQGAPYNNLCPELNNKTSVTGCVATAVAQVMYYHKWPQDETTSIPAYYWYSGKKNLTALPPVKFRWDSMKNYYRSSADPDSAVAKLMRYVGQAVEMDYSPEGSGTQAEKVPEALKKYFGYDQGLRLVERDGFTIDDWADLIYNELKEGRPVIYAGSSISTGHEFVCDGYSNGFFHINWGWGGYLDNYFRLSVLNPNSTSGTGAGTTEDGFHSFQSAVIGVQKPLDEPVKPHKTLTLNTFSGNDGNILFNARWTGQTSSFDYGIALRDENRELIVLDYRTSTFTNGTSRRYNNHRIDTLFTSPGRYEVVAVCCAEGDSVWQRLGSSIDFVEVNVTENGDSLDYNLTTHPVLNVELTNLELLTGLSKGNVCRMRGTIENHGDENNSTIYIYASADDNFYQRYPDGYLTLAIEGHTKEVVDFYFIPQSVDDVSIYFYDFATNSYLAIKSFPSYELEMTEATVEYDPLSVSITLRNNTETAYNRQLRAFVYDSQTNKQLGKTDRKLTIEPGESQTIVYDTFRLNEKSNYYMKFQFYKNEFSNTMVTLDSQVDILLADHTGIESITTDDTPHSPCFNLQGQRVEQTTAEKGIYIQGGRKVVK